MFVFVLYVYWSCRGVQDVRVYAYAYTDFIFHSDDELGASINVGWFDDVHIYKPWTQVYPCTLDFANGDSSFLRKYRGSTCSTIHTGIVTHSIIHNRCMQWYLCKQDAGKRHLTTHQPLVPATRTRCFFGGVYLNTYRISHKTRLVCCQTSGFCRNQDTWCCVSVPCRSSEAEGDMWWLFLGQEGWF